MLVCLSAHGSLDQKRIDVSSQYRQSIGSTAKGVSSQPLIQPSPGINLQGNKSTYRPNGSSKRTSKFFSIGAVEMCLHCLSFPAKSMPAIIELRPSPFRVVLPGELGSSAAASVSLAFPISSPNRSSALR